MASKKRDRQRLFVKARHDFTVEEYRAATDELTRAMDQVDEAKDAMKADAAKRKASIKQMEATVNELKNKVRNHGEDRDVEATVEFMPKKGKKVFRHHCPGKPEHDTVIREEPMTQLDYEGQLPLDDEPNPPKDKEDKAEGGEPETGTEA